MPTNPAATSNTAQPVKASDINGDMLKNLNTYAEIEGKLRTNDLEGAEKLASALVEKDPHNDQRVAFTWPHC